MLCHQWCADGDAGPKDHAANIFEGLSGVVAYFGDVKDGNRTRRELKEGDKFKASNDSPEIGDIVMHPTEEEAEEDEHECLWRNKDEHQDLATVPVEEEQSDDRRDRVDRIHQKVHPNNLQRCISKDEARVKHDNIDARQQLSTVHEKAKPAGITQLITAVCLSNRRLLPTGDGLVYDIA